MKTIVDYAQKVKEQHALNKTLAPVETDLTDASRSYAIGEQFINDGDLFKAKTAIAQHDALVLDTNYEAADDITTQIKNKTVTTDPVPTEGSTNPVQSNGVFVENRNIYEVMGKNGAKNLIPYPYAETTKTQNGVTFTDNGDGTITVNGTASANTLFTISTVLADVLLNDNTTEYILSGCEGGGGATYKLIVDDISDYSIICNQFDNEADFTIASSHHGIRASIVVYSGQVMSNVIFKPMIRLASDIDTTYQPYAKTNKELTAENEALTNQANDMVNVLGAKNLIPYPYHRQNGYTANGATFTYDDEGVITVNKVVGNSTAYFALFSNILYPDAEKFLEPNTSYILSMELENATDTSCFVQTQNGSDLAAIRNKTTGKYEISFTTTETVDSLAVALYYGAEKTENNAKVKLMIRLASINDSTYVPYAKTNRQLTAENQTLTNNLSDEVETRAKLGAHNLFDSKRLVQASPSGGITFTVSDDGSLSITGGTTSSYFQPYDSYVAKGVSIPYKPNTSYTFSIGEDKKQENIDLKVYYKATTESSWTVLQSASNVDEMTFTTPASFYDIIIRPEVSTGKAITTTTLYPLVKLTTDTSTEFISFTMTNRELTEYTSDVDSNSYTKDGILVRVYRCGRQVMFLLGGTATADIAAATVLCTLDSKFVPFETANSIAIKGANKTLTKLNIATNGQVYFDDAIANGEGPRLTSLCYIAKNP